MEMKTDNIEKDFDSVKTFREIKAKISKEIYGLNAEELKEYFAKQKKLNQIAKEKV